MEVMRCAEIFLHVILVNNIVAWHDLTNVQYHCWPFGASDNNPTSFAVCVGVDLDWIIQPPEKITHSTPFNASFSLVLDDEFFKWAVQDAQDGLKTNFFKYRNGSLIANDSITAKEWCERTPCPSDCSAANQDNCCIHHVNVHSCPAEEVRFGLCPPWIPANGDFYTHTKAQCGSSVVSNWTNTISGLHTKNYQTTATALVAHFKISTVHIALHFSIDVTPKAVCGDGICDLAENENCSVCGKDCGRCPMTAAGIAGIAIAGAVVLLIASSTLGYMKYKNERQLQDESWIIDYSEITQPDKQNTFCGSILNIMEAYDQMKQEKQNTEKSSRQLGVYKGLLCMMKRIRKSSNIKLTKQLRMEVRQMRTLDHTNILQFSGACIKLPNMFILSPYCPKGSLHDVLKKEDIPITWAFRFSFAHDIISGLLYLHSNNITHGALKKENCLLDDRWTIKISDFGLPSLRTCDVSDWNVYQARPAWLAPELPLMGSSQPGDIFAFGILIIQISTRCAVPSNPFASLPDVMCEWNNQLNMNLLAANGEKCPCPKEIKMLADLCLSEKHNNRPSGVNIKKQMRMLNPNKTNPVDVMLTMMERYSKHLEQMVAERTGDLMAEKHRTDELLHSMLPKQVADDLRMGRQVTAATFECCSIYFSDIVGFTTISGKLAPIDVVFLLNKLYSCFDHIVDKYDVYKVETIGDAYMVVSGVPKPNGNSHVIHIANFALQLLQEIKDFKIPTLSDIPLQIRIGIHSGPVCSGVVGIKMPRYCLFGDTVNTASRMESNGEANKIHISNSTKELIMGSEEAKRFKAIPRGTIAIKGKGDMTTWWLEQNRDIEGDFQGEAPPMSQNIPGQVY